MYYNMIQVSNIIKKRVTRLGINQRFNNFNFMNHIKLIVN
jgi:hypothetical protein